MSIANLPNLWGEDEAQINIPTTKRKKIYSTYIYERQIIIIVN